MYKSRDWFILAPIGAIAIALAFWGFSRCSGVNCAPEPAWKILQKSLNLIRGNGDFAFGQDPWQLVVAQYLVPAVALFAAAKLFLLNLRRDMRVAFARKSRNHTIVCGLGETGRHIVNNLRSIGERVVAIDLDSETPNALSCVHAGVPVIKGDATSTKTLELAALSRARALVATTGDDSRNFEIALRANDLRDRPRIYSRTMVVLPELRTHWLFGSVTNHQRATLGSQATEIRPFSTHEIAARLLYRSSAFARRRRALGACAPHVVIIGLGRVGQEVLLHGISTHFALPGNTPRFTIIDSKGERAADSLFAGYPGTRELADITFHSIPVSSDMDWSDLKGVLEESVITAVVVALPDDDLNLSVGIRIRSSLDRLKRLTTAVFTRLRHKRKLGSFAANLERIGPLRHRLIPFGDLSDLTNVGILFEHRLDTIARANHAVYLETLGAQTAGRSPADLPWEHLPEMYKRSNRHFADHVGVNVRAAGLRLRASKAPRLLVLRDAEIDQLAANEHWRWTVEHRMAGWSHGAERDDIARLHPALVLWETLPAKIQEQNRMAVRRLPTILDNAGVELRRERVVSAVGPDICRANEALDRHQNAETGEHLVLVIDPTHAESCEIGKRAARTGDISTWLLLSETTIAALGRDMSVLEPSKSIWDSSEGWIDMREFEGIMGAGAQIGEPPRDVASAPSGYDHS
jgi:voltage-gated potassium channel Kch